MRNYVKLVAAASVLTYAAAAWAGQEPYVAAVESDDSIPSFYISPKLFQFTHPNTNFPPDPDAGIPGEGFDVSRGAVPADEICDPTGGTTGMITNPNFLIVANNEGSFRWDIVVPKKPVGNLNITVQCGLLKPNAEALIGPDAINVCAGETGERVSALCDRRLDLPGRSNIVLSALPTLAAVAQPGDGDPNLPPFNLTAYRNPGSYLFSQAAGAMTNTGSMQVLDGSRDARFVLKACMTKSIFVKKPVTGQVNALGQTEFDLESGDVISVLASFPRGHTMDVYCHKQSAIVQGIGDPLTLIEGQP